MFSRNVNPFAAAERYGRKGGPLGGAMRTALRVGRKHEEENGQGRRQGDDQAHAGNLVSMASTIEASRQGSVSGVQGNG
jgi:hypothetical protein